MKPSENFRAVVAVTSLRTAVKDLTGFMESEPVTTPAWKKIRIDQTPAGKVALNAAKTSGIEKAEDKDYVPHRRMTDAVFGPKGIPK